MREEKKILQIFHTKNFPHEVLFSTGQMTKK